MPQSPREIVTNCLTFNYPERLPRDLWVLPIAEKQYPQVVEEINRKWPGDIVRPPYFYPPSARVKGDPYKVGSYTDEWGCVFENIQDGVIGEVRDPILPDISEWITISPPNEQIPLDTSEPYGIINRYCAETEKFVLANCCPRPWERYQFIRGTENALIDVMMPDHGFKDLLKRINDFYLKELEFWVKTDVDGIMFMDDWGAQNQLLINPELWRALFKPIYREYCELTKTSGKFVFMHSDGYITDIYADLVEIGVDALNSQIFCMDLAALEKRFKGKITFWGEIDRQHILTSSNPQDGRDAVNNVLSYLYDPAGGLIAQFEFGAGSNPETAYAIMDEWNKYPG